MSKRIFAVMISSVSILWLLYIKSEYIFLPFDHIFFIVCITLFSFLWIAFFVIETKKFDLFSLKRTIGIIVMLPVLLYALTSIFNIDNKYYAILAYVSFIGLFPYWGYQIYNS